MRSDGEMQTVIAAIVPRRSLSDNYLIGLRNGEILPTMKQSQFFCHTYIEKRESSANKKKAEKVLKRKQNFSSHFIEDKKWEY